MPDQLSRSVLIMAGGTGGHVFPALAAAECLRAKGLNVEWLGTQRGIESRLVPAANIPLHFIQVSGLRGKGVFSKLGSLFRLFGALRQSLAILRRLQPVCVLGMGGFASGPGGLASWLTGRPLVIHEQNSVAGTTNKLLARFAKKILLGYPNSLSGQNTVYIGNPVRKEIAAIPAPEQRLLNRDYPLRLLVLGGSLGAKPINELLPKTLQLMDKEQRPIVRHQAGEAHIDDVRLAYLQAGVEVEAVAFISDMAAAYSWADIVLCRAGALTVAELTAAGVASILVPLPHAIDDHQTGNAQWLEKNGAGLLKKQTELDAEQLSDLLSDLGKDRARIKQMSVAARQLAKVNAAERVADICLEVACG